MKEIKQMIDQEKQKSSAPDEQPQTESSAINQNTSQTPAENQAQGQQARQQTENTQSSADPANLSVNQPTSGGVDNPDIGGGGAGPLFIRQSKFDDASRMIGQMRQLSREMQQVTQQLSQGMEQDAQTERRARELLKELDDGRRNVQDVVSPED